MEEIKEINMKEIEEALQSAKEDIANAKADLKLDKIDLRETMAKAQAKVNDAKEELKAYQEMVYKMENDGLLNTHHDYTIEYRKGEIFVNGKKQSSEVTAKYRNYFKKESVIIKKQDGDLDINVD
jgi:hypothetical protein